MIQLQNRRSTKVRRAMTIMAASFAAMAMCAGTADAIDIRFMTGPSAGGWVPLGGQIKELWEKAVADLRVQIMPGGGIANIRGVEEGKAEAGFAVTINTADAIAGTGEPPLDKKHGKVCNIATLYPLYFQLMALADAGISTFQDLKGKEFATAVKGNTGELVSRHVLKASGLSPSDVRWSYSNNYTDIVEQMKDNRIHALTVGTGVPSGPIMDLASARDIKILDMAGIYEGMKSINPAYKLSTIPKDTYPKQDQDVRVISYDTHVIVSCSLPEDAVYKMTAALASGKDVMASIQKELGAMTLQVMAQEIGVPFHPGAAKWYREQGITTH
jgi:uncharacterized protein